VKRVQVAALLIVVAGLLLLVAYVASNRETQVLDASAREAAGGQYVVLSAGVTHYEFSGDSGKPVVVLVHGGTIPMWIWDPQVPALTGAGFRVLRYDLYGRGTSDRPEVEYDRQLFGAQLLDLLDALSIEEPVDLVGLSFGAAMAATFATHHPERVRRLVLLAPLLDYSDQSLSGIAAMLGIGEFLMRVIGVPRTIRRAGPFLSEGGQSGKYADLFEEQVSYRGYAQSLLSMMRSDALGDYRATYRAVGTQDRRVLLIWGDTDQEVPRAHIKEIQDAIPGVQYRELSDVGHGLTLQDRDGVNRLLVEFLR
jgi:pimeloyl-ACP methyl ester carboxylesterase